MTEPGPKGKGSPWRLLLGTALGAAIVAGGAFAYRLVFVAEGEAPQWILASYTGQVTVRIDGGEWQEPSIKQRLAGNDEVRTGADGEATLVHESSHLTVRAETEIQVADLEVESSRFRVTEGQVYVEARGDRISMRTLTGANVDASEAGLGMSVSAEGLVVVDVKRGVADFSAMGRTEQVSAGQRSMARAGRPPTRPVAIPDALLLNVRFPDSETFNARLARIEGISQPGTRVRVAGQTVKVAEDGTFAADVILEEGPNQIEVAASDAAGRTRTERSRPIQVDLTPPALWDASIGSRAVGGGGPAPSPTGRTLP